MALGRCDRRRCAVRRRSALRRHAPSDVDSRAHGYEGDFRFVGASGKLRGLPPLAGRALVAGPRGALFRERALAAGG